MENAPTAFPVCSMAGFQACPAGWCQIKAGSRGPFHMGRGHADGSYGARFRWNVPTTRRRDHKATRFASDKPGEKGEGGHWRLHHGSCRADRAFQLVAKS